jgi:hypothetical protein
MITCKIIGKKYIDYMIHGNVKKDHKDNIIHALNEHGKEVTDALVKITSRGSRSGKSYFYKGIKYQASAGGEPPQSVTGKLNKSFKWKANIKQLTVGNSAFSKGAPYPMFLEEGTSRMDARPYFILTIEKLQSRLREDLQRIKLSV